jgi:antitoxin component YwqK of YwqJK toxin-antitoxin module
MKGKLILYITISKLLLIANYSFGQDPNLSRVFDLKNYSIDYDSIKKYYPAFQIHYNDTLAGFALTNYHGYDSLSLHIDYMSGILIDRKRIAKGMGYEIRPEGTFFEIAYSDWSGKKHGNQMTFYPDGSVKLNEVWDRGKLLRHWKYKEKGELEEYKEFE